MALTSRLLIKRHYYRSLKRTVLYTVLNLFLLRNFCKRASYNLVETIYISQVFFFFFYNAKTREKERQRGSLKVDYKYIQQIELILCVKLSVHTYIYIPIVSYSCRFAFAKAKQHETAIRWKYYIIT